MANLAQGTGTMLVLACAIALAGCAAPIDHGDLDAADSPVARYDWDAGGPRETALLTGVLELRDGCLYVVGTGDAADLTTVPVLPRELTAWDAELETLTYAGVEYAMGDAVAAGGGWGEPHDGVDLPDACEPDEWGEVMYVQDESLAP
ncbi:hypothetical protein [Demequina sp. NBRC 110054]|uniref:hypothetical protein n=1 Tax=Demequina sp. NBRC 110054 TaxID=1570343 RepID=UPI000A071A18|nr:hypothetical protein [Demequina sp. NBRC 110054]